jgi:hypothetical protein
MQRHPMAAGSKELEHLLVSENPVGPANYKIVELLSGDNQKF